MSRVKIIDDLDNQFVRQPGTTPAEAEGAPALDPTAVWSALDANQRKAHEDRRYVDRLERRVALLEEQMRGPVAVIAANAVERRDDERRFADRRNRIAPAGSWNDVERRIGERRRPADVSPEDESGEGSL